MNKTSAHASAALLERSMGGVGVRVGVRVGVSVAVAVCVDEAVAEPLGLVVGVLVHRRGRRLPTGWGLHWVVTAAGTTLFR